jgi:hypothetical protein
MGVKYSLFHSSCWDEEQADHASDQEPINLQLKHLLLTKSPTYFYI